MAIEEEAINYSTVDDELIASANDTTLDPTVLSTQFRGSGKNNCKGG
jgi:hypothetical protein